VLALLGFAKLAAVYIFFAASIYAQGSGGQEIALAGSGRPVVGVSVTVCTSMASRKVTDYPESVKGTHRTYW
jgi:hypothetical protein